MAGVMSSEKQDWEKKEMHMTEEKTNTREQQTAHLKRDTIKNKRTRTGAKVREEHRMIDSPNS